MQFLQIKTLLILASVILVAFGIYHFAVLNNSSQEIQQQKFIAKKHSDHVLSGWDKQEPSQHEIQIPGNR